MNTTTFLHHVERVDVREPDGAFNPATGRKTWCRTIVCHGGDKTHTFCLHADAQGALQLHFAPADLDACLAGLSPAQLDELIAAAKTERMSRDPDTSDMSDAERNGYGCAATGCGQAVEFGSDWCRDHMPVPVLPRDCDGGLSDEDKRAVARRMGADLPPGGNLTAAIMVANPPPPPF